MKDFYENLKRASVRTRRLLAVALYDLVRGYSPSAAYDDMVVLCKAAADDGDRHWTERRLETEALGLSANAELAVELAHLCSRRDVDCQQLCSIVWAIRGMMSDDDGEIFQIAECLDLSDPRTGKRSRVERYPPHVVSIAEQVYEGDHGAIPILADAMDEIGLDAEHLRARGRHWKGCWVVDNVLRRS